MSRKRISCLFQSESARTHTAASRPAIFYSRPMRAEFPVPILRAYSSPKESAHAQRSSHTTRASEAHSLFLFHTTRALPARGAALSAPTIPRVRFPTETQLSRLPRYHACPSRPRRSSLCSIQTPRALPERRAHFPHQRARFPNQRALRPVPDLSPSARTARAPSPNEFNWLPMAKT